MTADRSEDEDFVARLARFDENLAKRKGPILPAPDVPAKDRERFERAASTLHMLEAVWPRVSPDTPTHSQDKIESFGRFRIERELGRGGFGVVFAAFDPMLGRRIALKIPKPQVIASAALVDRFLKEARAAANLSHPNIVQVYEAGFVGLTCYSVSELCDGPTLAQWFQNHRVAFDPNVAARLLLILANAIEHAHRNGVLHRDLKPSNVLLAPLKSDDSIPKSSDEESLGFRPKLSDFGLAKLLETSSTETPTGSLVGTPEYMSPEQAEGRIEEITAATDVYGLGALLYELLVGRPPIQGATDLDKLRRIGSDEIRPLRELRRNLPADLEAIAQRCLEKNPANRYPSAASLADDLRRFLDGQPTIARPFSFPRRCIRWLRRRANTVAPFALAMVFAVVAAVGAWQFERARHDNLTQQPGPAPHFQYVADMVHARQALDNADVATCIEQLEKYLPPSSLEDLRGYEWRRLWQLSHDDTATFNNFSDVIYSVDFSPDGKWLVASSADGKVYLWNSGDGLPKSLEPPHRNEVNAVRFAPDGNHFASASDDATIQLRNRNGELVHTLRGHLGAVTSLDFLPDSQVLVSAGRDGQVIRWNTNDPKPLTLGSVAPRDVESIAAHPNSKQIFFIADDILFRFETADAPNDPKPFAQFPGFLIDLKCTPDGKHVVVVSQNRFVYVVDAQSAEIVKSWKAHRDWINAVEITPDSQFCITASRDCTARVFHLQTGESLAKIVGHRGRVWGLAIDPSGEILATAGNDPAVKLWNTRTASAAPNLHDYEHPPIKTLASADNKRLVVPFPDGRIDIWNLERRVPIANWRSQNNFVDVAFQDDNTLITASADGAISTIKIDRPTLRESQLFKVDAPISLAAPAAGFPIAVGLKSGVCEILGPDRPAMRLTPPDHDNACRVAMSRDGTRIVTFSYSPSAAVWDAQSGQKLFDITSHSQHINTVRFSPDGTILATASGDSNVGLWDIAKARQITILHGEGEEAVELQFSPDCRTLLTAYKDGKLRLWNVATWQDMYGRTTRVTDIRSMAMTPDQRYLAVLGLDPKSGRYQILLSLAASDRILTSASNH